MGLETATYINGLNISNPTSNDNVGDGDNHLRLLKTVLRQTFAANDGNGLTGAITATHTQINTAATDVGAATDANTASTIVRRDASGNFTVGTITGNVNGNLVGDMQGDIYAHNGVNKILENGTDGSNASFTGDVTGNVTGNVTGSAASITTTSVSADVNHRMVFGQDKTVAADGTENIAIAADDTFHYNPSTKTLTADNFSGATTIANVTGLQTALNAAPTFLTIYPVGSIYLSVDSAFDPAATFGGTWSKFSQGRMLVGLDDSATPDTDFDTVGEENGFKTHTLTTNEMPSHTHSFTQENTQGSGTPGASNGTSSFSTVNTSSTGGGAAHNNMPPYLVVCMWKRTA